MDCVLCEVGTEFLCVEGRESSKCSHINVMFQKKHVLLFQSTQTGSGAHPASYSMVGDGSFRGGKA